ncbi:MAG: Mbeg1-like protein [Lachnospiraceae bacterium]|nr:Mbeg1-like protein [Lachnospiraceae bacterium]
MSDILTYLTDYGDETFAERPFSIADNFCLSALSYFDVSPVGDRISGGEHMTIKEMVGALDLSAVETRGLVTFPVVFLQLMAESKRFGDTMVSDYTEIMDTERECQFAAFRYTMSDGAAYFAFRGTDASIIGWKEDFLLACGETAAQRSAVRWLEHAIKGVRRRRPCYVGGHSKGGNLAVYAGAYCNDETFERITTVYSNDGPGLCRDWTPDERIERVRPLVVKTVPEYSIVGMLFPDGIPFRILKSNEKGSYQHNIFSWQLTSDAHPVYADAIDKDAARVNTAFRNWIDGEDMDHRMAFIINIFDAMQKEDATTLAGATSFDGWERIFFTVAKKRGIWSTVGNLVKSFVKAFTDKDSDDYAQMTGLITGCGMILIGFLILILSDIAFLVVGAGLALLIFILMVSRLVHNAHRDIPKGNKAVLITADCAVAVIAPIFSFSASNLEAASAALLGIALFAYGVYCFAKLLKDRSSRLLAFRSVCAIGNALAIFGLPLTISDYYLIATGMNIVLLGFLHIYGGQEPQS